MRNRETHPSVTKPETPKVDEQEIDAPDRPNRSRRAFLIGAGSTAAALALAGGLFIGLKGDGEKTEPRSEPGTSAPANPNTPTPSVTESTPTTLELNNNTVVLVGADGEAYQGREAYVAANELTEEKYPETSDRVRAFVEVGMNTWVNAGNTPKDTELYEGTPPYTSADGQRYGSGGVAQDFYQPSIQHALVGSGEFLSDNISGATPDDFVRFMNEFNFENIALWNKAEDDKVPFRGEFKVEGEPDVQLDSVPVPGKPNMTETAVIMNVVYSDNGHLNTVGELRSKPGGFRGVDTPQYKRLYQFTGTFVTIDGVTKYIGGSMQSVESFSN